jgi:hypothetical protein
MMTLYPSLQCFVVLWLQSFVSLSMAALQDTLLIQELTDAITVCLNLFEVRCLHASSRIISPVIRAVFAARAQGVCLYVHGGSTEDGDDVTSVKCFALAQSQWSSLPHLPESTASPRQAKVGQSTASEAV